MKQSVSVMKKKADAIFSIYVRTRDADQDGLVPCITCKAKRPIKEMRFDEENCNAQCPGCNVFRYGEQYLYALAIDDKYGDGTADRLMQQRFSTHKFTVQELQEIIDYAKQGIADRE
jgi:hypothetical protein